VEGGEGRVSDVTAVSPTDVAVRIADRLRFWCPGCDTIHEVRVTGPYAWSWNDDVDQRVTLMPSILVREYEAQREARRCHSYVSSGQIQFLDDCTHALKGSTHPLPLVSTWRFGATDG
jgi:Family of unknown function (DUF6527)